MSTTIGKNKLSILSKGAGNRTSGASYKQSCELVDLSGYKKLRISEESPNVVISEAMVTMEELVRFAVKAEMIPKVVPEFRDITVGGAISGASLESTSHRYGQFMDTVTWVKVRKGDGTVVTTHRGDSLWCNVSGTYGTFGIILEAAIECQQAEPSVIVTYFCFRTVDSAISYMMTASDKKHAEFLEGLEFPPQQVGNSGCTVVMQGKMISAKRETTTLGWFSKIQGGTFYYEHIRDLIKSHIQGSKMNLWGQASSSPFHEEIIPIEDFLFRYDYGAFWMARPLAFEYSKLWSYFPFTIILFVVSCRLVRNLTGILFTTRRLFRMLKSCPKSVVARKMVIQDLYMPVTKAAELVKVVRASIPLTTPIWLCPVRANSNQPFTPSFHKENEMLVNCGIYGRVADGRGKEYTKSILEETCMLYGGRKMLYAQSYYAEDTFWNIYDKKKYEEMRLQHMATGCFPDIYEKTCLNMPEKTNPFVEFIAELVL